MLGWAVSLNCSAGGAARGRRGVGPIREAVVVDDTHAKIPFANSTEFYAALGRFHAAWSRADLVIDCAIWKAGTETQEDVHKRVAGMQFGPKCDYFLSLLPTSKFENIQKVEELLRLITDAKRNEFSHSFLASDEGSVSFIYRKTRKDKYEVKQATVTPEEFFDHVEEFIHLSFDFQSAVGLSDWEVAGFAAAA
jgi:hypothetical protein